jgi:hypothetical protein
MKPAFKLILPVLALVIAAQPAAEEWRGIKPLSSTREDVVREFAACADERDWCEFMLDNEDVEIVFSGAQNCNNLRPGMVLSVQRVLRKATSFEALHVDKRRFTSFDPSPPRNMGYRGFIDEKSGLLLKTFRGQIFQINYIPRKQDWQVCPDYYRKPREFVAVFFPHVLSVNSVVCPTNNPSAGEKVQILANYASTGQRMSLFWVTTAGKIVEGQETKRILLDTTGLAGKSVNVTVEIGDSAQHVATGSCSFNVAPTTKN